MPKNHVMNKAANESGLRPFIRERVNGQRRLGKGALSPMRTLAERLKPHPKKDARKVLATKQFSLKK